MMTLGEEIASLRRAAGLKLSELAARSGLSKQALLDIELNRERPPDPVLKTLAEHLQHVGGTYEYLTGAASKTSERNGDLSAFASVLSATAWEFTTVEGEKIGPLAFDMVVRGMREGWLRAEDSVRSAVGQPTAESEKRWEPIHQSLGTTFRVGVWINAPRAFGRRFGGIGAVATAAAALIALTTYSGIARFALDPVRALLLGVGIPILLLLLFAALVRIPVTLIIVPIVFFGGFPLLAAITGIPTRQLTAEFTNLFSVLTIVVTLAVGGFAGYGLGYGIGVLVGSLRRGFYRVPAARQPPPELSEPV